jgi:hypothetical protein
MSHVKKIAAGAGIVGALAITVLGPATGVANADTASPYLGGFASDNPGYGPGYGYGYGPGYGWAGAPGQNYGPGGYGPGYGYNGACAWVPPFITQWIPPVVCGG